MSAVLLDGRSIARQIREEVKSEVEDLRQTGIKPCLAVLLVGENPASEIYVASKQKACEKVGIESQMLRLPASASEREILRLVSELNSDEKVHGILVQLPLPDHIDELRVIDSIDPRKDVDGFTPENLGRLLLGKPYTVPCTPAGIVELLRHYGLQVEGSNVVIIGRSNIVGKPLAALLVQKAEGYNCTVTICHSKTRDVTWFTKSADIIVTAMGRAGFLKADMVRSGSIIIDVGINRITDVTAPKGYRIVGDADFDDLRDIASHITPVPGGVGPMTVAMLLRNTLKVARSSQWNR